MVTYTIAALDLSAVLHARERGPGASSRQPPVRGSRPPRTS